MWTSAILGSGLNLMYRTVTGQAKSASLFVRSVTQKIVNFRKPEIIRSQDLLYLKKLLKIVQLLSRYTAKAFSQYYIYTISLGMVTHALAPGNLFQSLSSLSEDLLVNWKHCNVSSTGLKMTCKCKEHLTAGFLIR